MSAKSSNLVTKIAEFEARLLELQEQRLKAKAEHLKKMNTLPLEKRTPFEMLEISNEINKINVRLAYYRKKLTETPIPILDKSEEIIIKISQLEKKLNDFIDERERSKAEYERKMAILPPEQRKEFIDLNLAQSIKKVRSNLFYYRKRLNLVSGNSH